MTLFRQGVINITRMIPPGKVMSYGQIAAYLGAPRGARVVGWMLRSTEGKENIPWWRVMNNEGRITIKGNRYNTPSIQGQLLEGDGVEVSSDLTIDMEKYRFVLSLEEVKKLELPEFYLKKLQEKKFI